MTGSFYTSIETGSGLPNFYQALGCFRVNNYVPSSNRNKYDSINHSTEKTFTSFHVRQQDVLDKTVISSRKYIDNIWIKTAHIDRNISLRNHAVLIKIRRIK